VISISYTPSSPSLAILGERYAPKLSKNSITVTARKLAQRRLDRSGFGTLKKTAASGLAHGFFFVFFIFLTAPEQARRIC
jgi:hypothetical protein